MKTNYFIPLLLLFLFSCQTEEKINPTPVLTAADIEGSHLNIDGIKSYLPQALKNERTAVFIDEENNIKTLQTAYEEYTGDAEVNGLNYTYDQAEVTYFSEELPDFQIVLIPSANYSASYEIFKYLTILLIGENQEAASGSIFFDDHGPTDSPFNNYQASVNLGGQTFEHAYLISNSSASSYSEIYMNQEIGIVAFRGSNNELFVFKEFID